MLEHLAREALTNKINDVARDGMAYVDKGLEQTRDDKDLTPGAWADIQTVQGQIDGIRRSALALGLGELNEPEQAELFRAKKRQITAFLIALNHHFTVRERKAKRLSVQIEPGSLGQQAVDACKHAIKKSWSSCCHSQGCLGSCGEADKQQPENMCGHCRVEMVVRLAEGLPAYHTVESRGY